MAISNNNSSYLDYGTESALGAGSDWSASVFLTPLADSGTDGSIVAKRSSFSSGSNQYQFALGFGNSRRPAITKNSDFIIWEIDLALSAFYIVTVTGSSSGARLWVNSTEITTVSVSNIGASGDWRTGSLAPSSAIQLFAHSSGSEFFYGSVAELALWSKALDESEVLSLHQGISPAHVGSSSLAMHWDFRGGLTRERRQGYAATITGTINEEIHPRVYA
jgi:Concanavalin A-like lectin/glucanases superfamily